MNIPSKFYHTDEEAPIAYTVGELIEILKELPPELPAANITITAMTIGHVQFEEP